MIATHVLVTDFDGTITSNDFYCLAVERLLDARALGPWKEYRAGTITHLQALQRIFATINAPEKDILTVVGAMHPDPQLATAVDELRRHGWEIIVASAGCRWYIDHILKGAGVTLEVHANPGHYVNGALHMEAPTDSPFYSAQTGIDKLGIVEFHKNRGAVVAYAGDGFTDVEAALRVPPKMRFARADLAASLKERGESFLPFTVWSDIAQHLLAR